MARDVDVRRQCDDDSLAVAEVTRQAFGPEGDAVALLPSALSSHPLARPRVTVVERPCGRSCSGGRHEVFTGAKSEVPAPFGQ